MSKLQPIRIKKDDNKDVAYPPVPEKIVDRIFDNHTHFDISAGVVISPEEQLAKANLAGVTGVVQVGTDLETSKWSAELAETNKRVLAAVALHPNEAPKLALKNILNEHIEGIALLAKKPRVRAIGETGLDYFRTGEEGIQSQKYSFRKHIEIAKENNLALQIHDRDAHEDVVDILLDMGAPERTVFHCFSGDEELVNICVKNSWYMSFAGTLTFKNAHNLHRAAKLAPPELILLETDAPFLTPTPFRGKPNASYLISHTLKYLSEITGKPIESLANQIAYNTEIVYGLWQEDNYTKPDKV